MLVLTALIARSPVTLLELREAAGSSGSQYRHHHPRDFLIKPANAVGADNKIGRIENLRLTKSNTAQSIFVARAFPAINSRNLKSTCA